MSTIPAALRDAVVRRLEDALRQRDREIDRLREEGFALRARLEEQERDLLDLQGQVRAVRTAEEEASAAEQRERARALAALRDLSDRAARDHGELLGQVREASERQQVRSGELLGRVEILAGHRLQREQERRSRAREAVGQARAALGGLDLEILDAMDLGAEAATAAQRIAEAQALLEPADLPPEEAEVCGEGARGAVLLLKAALEGRWRQVEEDRQRLRARAEALRSATVGEAIEGLDDQRAELDSLLCVERDLVLGLIDQEVGARIDRLGRWNGHTGRCAAVDRAIDLLAAEVMAMRHALPAGCRHDAQRYDLAQAWPAIELRLGRIRHQGRATPGIWLDAPDRKSTYAFLLSSTSGELRVDVPWEGPIQVHHEGRVVLELPVSRAPDAEVRLLGLARVRLEALRASFSPTASLGVPR